MEGINTYDVIVIGSGPGGATVARELAASGRKVLILERGGGNRVKPVGSMPGLRAMLAMTDFHFLGGMRTMVRGVTHGGSSMLYFATAWPTPLDMFAQHQIDLTPYLEQVREEVPGAPLPEHLIGPAARRIMDAARECGFDWQPLPKLINPKRAEKGNTYAAKWNARGFLRQALNNGAALHSGAHVQRILHEGGEAVGVQWRTMGKLKEARAPQIVLAAGGVGSPLILRNSGFGEIEGQFFCDPIVAVFGKVRDVEVKDEFAMATGWRHPDGDYMLADLSLPLPLFASFSALAGRPHRIFSRSKTLTLMVKIPDQIGGSISQRGRFLKSFSSLDHGRMQNGIIQARKILERAGASSIYQSPITSAHPGGTLPIGKHTDANLETKVQGLYVCDCSVIPEAWGLPPTLTILALAKRLAGHLTNQP